MNGCGRLTQKADPNTGSELGLLLSALSAERDAVKLLKGFAGRLRSRPREVDDLASDADPGVAVQRRLWVFCPLEADMEHDVRVIGEQRSEDQRADQAGVEQAEPAAHPVAGASGRPRGRGRGYTARQPAQRRHLGGELEQIALAADPLRHESKAQPLAEQVELVSRALLPADIRRVSG